MFQALPSAETTNKLKENLYTSSQTRMAWAQLITTALSRKNIIIK
jgi:hypothetical protein